MPEGAMLLLPLLRKTGDVRTIFDKAQQSPH